MDPPDVVCGVRISHPDRIVFDAPGTTKIDLARYYERVADVFLPELAARPASLLRCPDGASGKCFFQKHLKDGLSGIARIDANGPEPAEASEDADAELVVESLEGVVRLVQRGVIEFHTWGSSAPPTAHANRITIDLDPDDAVPWHAVVAAARTARALFEEHGMRAWLKTTGGKGLHLVAPILPESDWTAVKAFAHRFAGELERREPERFVSKMSKARRVGRVYVDYLRNAEEATAIAAWSLRARPGGPVSMPILWDELDASHDVRGAWFNVDNADRRIDGPAQRDWAAMPERATRLVRVS